MYGDLKRVFNADYISRLDNIKQWLERDRIQQESVTQHSFKVSVFANCILDELWPDEKADLKIMKFKYQTLKMAMYHDFDEAILCRDISHELKYNGYNGEQIRQALDDYVNHVFRVWDNDNDSNIAKLILKKVPNYQLMHAIVKVADWFALLFFLCREAEISHASWVKNHITYCNEGCQKAITNLFFMLKVEGFDFDEEYMNGLIRLLPNY